MCLRSPCICIVVSSLLLAAGPSWAVDIVVDNTDSGFSVVSGSWSTRTSGSNWYGTNYRRANTATSANAVVQWQPTLPSAGDYQVFVWYPSGDGTHITDARYTVYYNGGNQTFSVNQQTNTGQWVLLGTFNFPAGSTSNGRVRLSNQSATSGARVFADAVRFYRPDGPPQPEFRGFWADVFHIGMQNAAQIDQMIDLAVQGNYNAIVAQVLAYHDTEVGSHGAYWKSNIVPRSIYVTESFDPLGYLVQKARDRGLEVHCWLVAFRVSSVWPPVGNPFLAGHPEWLKVPRANMGTVAPVGSYYEFDPGSPDVQDYLASIVRELLANYEIDGIHWDYIRYTARDSGYPADTSYANSSLKRFQRIYGRTDVPAATGDAQWDDFRRRTVTEVVRRMTWEIPLVTSNPRQPVRYSSAVVTWYPCNTNFHNTRPYYEVFSDWEDWQSKGYLDSPILMAYFDEDGSYKQTYRDWVNNSVNLWRYGRQMIIGPGINMNSFANSINQMQYARNAGADGLCTYSYNSTCDTGATWSNWYSQVAANLFTSPVPVPTMPWRDPATATEGVLYGRVTLNGQPVDDATVQVGSLDAIKTDAGGYYVVCKIPAASGGTTYTVTASSGTMNTSGSATIFPAQVERLDFSLGPPVITQHPGNQSVCPGGSTSFTVVATGSAPISYRWRKNGVDLNNGGHYSGVTTATLTISNADGADVADYSCRVTNGSGSATSNAAHLTLRPATVITTQPQPQNVCPGTSATFTVAATGEGTVTYQWRKNGADLANGGHYAGVTTPTLTVSNASSADAGSYTCVVTAGCGSVTSNSAALTLGPDSDGDGWGDACDNCPNVPNSTQADADGDGKGDACDACPGTISGAPVDAQGCPPLVPGDFDRDGDVDADDFDLFQSCFAGPGVPVESSCETKKLDADDDIDQDDFGIFQRCLSGPNILGNPDCAG
ncbi:MAG TPA: family 10 glycosylhydrolase [Phycisphaerae bacterium]|nr:family 10 glycosylhydrolase [Phycisphaerae bacterium]HOJ56856.1 family 10 glycosylhydrolase [Phycisphaerae bacterium]HOL28578.1 family 10 glycosylhydrolase [Phycisphaerae bacterium]HPP23093.1 family 10 glycosylhydrolase [Phycisphaerae bacterium]